MQSICDRRVDLHVGIIMDGNGRWAVRKGLPRTVGHQVGVATIRRLLGAIPETGISTLSLFAFSSDNWRRPEGEVKTLMSLLRHYLRADIRELIENGVRLTVVGRRDRLPEGLAQEIAEVERASSHGQRLHLRIAVDYSSRDAILEAAARWRADRPPSRAAFAELLAASASEAGPDVDLLIRSGGEKRLSDFLLWESAYAELCFVDTLWPDFGAHELCAALAEFHRRERRFGGLGAPAALAAAE